MSDDTAKNEAQSQDCKNSGAAPCYVQGTFLWYEVNESCLPVRDSNEFYGARYSKPVHIANSHTGQVEDATVIYDFIDKGWCLHNLPDGGSCKDYELMLPTHFCYIPPFSR